MRSRRPRIVKVDEGSHGQEVGLQVGDTLEVSLRGNPSTGYAWLIDELPPGIRPSRPSEYIPDSSGRIGGGGTSTLAFLAEAKGTARLVLVYRRPWEGWPPERRFEAIVAVR